MLPPPLQNYWREACPHPPPPLPSVYAYVQVLIERGEGLCNFGTGTPYKPLLPSNSCNILRENIGASFSLQFCRFKEGLHGENVA